MCDVRITSLMELVQQIPEPNASLCLGLLQANADRLASAWGSSHNHQAYPGGYLDHIAVEIFPTMTRIGPLPFELPDALLVLFVHDLEKPWKEPASLWTKNKKSRADFRRSLITKAGITLSAEQENALRYVEGKGTNTAKKSE